MEETQQSTATPKKKKRHVGLAHKGAPLRASGLIGITLALSPASLVRSKAPPPSFDAE